MPNPNKPPCKPQAHDPAGPRQNAAKNSSQATRNHWPKWIMKPTKVESSQTSSNPRLIQRIADGRLHPNISPRAMSSFGTVPMCGLGSFELSVDGESGSWALYIHGMHRLHASTAVCCMLDSSCTMFAPQNRESVTCTITILKSCGSSFQPHRESNLPTVFHDFHSH